jgi:Protein of unknown function (DUF3182)
LKDTQTYSVGFINIGSLEISYCGTQALTPNDESRLVYGGSNLFVVRGGADALLQQPLGDRERLAIEQAIAYEAAVRQHFPGLSRRNYDILQGRDACGRLCSGVLEQSWRIGGASTAEIVAFETFQADPSLQAVKVTCAEKYGRSIPLPPQASRFFSGLDENVGYITKYAMVVP